MAIRLSKETKIGVNAEYWRIAIATIEARNLACYICLEGFLNQQARIDKQPITTIELSVPWSAFQNSNNPNIRDIYLYLKSTPDWIDGEDV